MDPKTMLKTQFFEKKLTFPLKNGFWPVFSRNMESRNLRGRVWKGPQNKLKTIVQLIRSFLWDLRGRQKKKHFKKAIFPVEMNLANFFLVFSSIESEKPQETIYEGPQGISILTVEVKRSFN